MTSEQQHRQPGRDEGTQGKAGLQARLAPRCCLTKLLSRAGPCWASGHSYSSGAEHSTGTLLLAVSSDSCYANKEQPLCVRTEVFNCIMTVAV